MPRITMDAIEELGSERLEKAVEKARSDNRKTLRAKDLEDSIN